MDNLVRATKDVAKHNTELVLCFNLEDFPLFMKETEQVLLENIAKYISEAKEIYNNVSIGFRYIEGYD
jgi:hypothetical protein